MRLRFWPLQLWITVQKMHRRRPDILRDIPTGAVPLPGTAWQRRERMLSQRAPLPKGLWMKAEPSMATPAVAGRRGSADGVLSVAFGAECGLYSAGNGK